jgi:penicillin amidase
VPFEDLPRSFNPREGYIATANNKTIPKKYQYDVGHEWSTFRIQRIKEVLEGARKAKKRLTTDDMAGLQNDVVSEEKKSLFPPVKYHHEPGAPKAFLEGFDGIITKDSSEALNFELFMDGARRRFATAMLPDKPKLVLDALNEKTLSEVSRDCHILIEPWSKDVPLGAHYCMAMYGNTELERSPSIERRREELGLQESESWGALHMARFRHPLSELTSGKWDLGPVPRSGDETTVNSTSVGDNWEQTGGASFREIIDLSDWDKSEAINVPGQSGVPGSPHYADLLPIWAEGKYFPLLYSRTGIENAAEEKFELVP